jgi:hypothetical protein
MISPRNTPLANDDTIPERGIYRGIIVDRAKYEVSRPAVGSTISTTHDAFTTIVPADTLPS